jgi:hypothetical protein
MPIGERVMAEDKEWMLDPYTKGYKAQKRGATKGGNPYSATGETAEDHVEWEEGFDASIADKKPDPDQ